MNSQNEGYFPHYAKLCKARERPRYSDERFRRFFDEAEEVYWWWREENMKITGTSKNDIRAKVELLNKYKDKLEFDIAAKYGVHPIDEDKEGKFTGQSGIFSSILEEFLYYLFKDVIPQGAVMRRKAYAGLVIMPKNIQELVEGSMKAIVETRDLDFIIGAEYVVVIKPKTTLDRLTSSSQRLEATIPIVAFECKTNIDKSMIDRCIADAEILKRGNPNLLYVVLAEYLDFNLEAVPLRATKVDQIYILRRMKRLPSGKRTLEALKDREPIHYDLVLDLFELVKNHLEYGTEEALKRGKLI